MRWVAAEISYSYLPKTLHGGVRRWIENGIEPGDFLCAVIQNNLTESFFRADEDNRENLFRIVSWFYNQAPGGCWGGEEKFRAWKERGVLLGLVIVGGGPSGEGDDQKGGPTC